MPNASVTTTLGAVFDTELVGGKNRQGVCLTACTSGGSTPYTRVLTADNNAAVVKASPGQLYSLWGTNLSATAYRFFVKVYDLAVTPNPASDTPKLIYGFDVDLSTPYPSPNGIEFTTGIAILVVKNPAFTDNTAITAIADGVISMEFK